MFTNCTFPGGEGNINLATLLDHGSFLVGENTLTYSKENDFVVPNSFNYFYKQQASNVNSYDRAEIKVIQCHYKAKMEFIPNGIFGYYFD